MEKVCIVADEVRVGRRKRSHFIILDSDTLSDTASALLNQSPLGEKGSRSDVTQAMGTVYNCL